MRRLLLIALLAAFAPCMNAQRISHASHFPSGVNRGSLTRSSFYPLAFSDPLYSDYLYSTGYPVASQPPMIFLQAPPTAAPAPERYSSPAQPLMIELRGDRYVRVSGPEAFGAEMIDQDAIDRKAIDRQTDRMSNSQPRVERQPAAPAPAALPAVLIFRDGHREQISDYTIADGFLYTHADYYTTGSWNRKIELSSLNLPETIASNQSRGAPFQLPSSPNEVIVGP